MDGKDRVGLCGVVGEGERGENLEGEVVWKEIEE